MKKIIITALFSIFFATTAQAEVYGAFGRSVQQKQLTDKIDTLDKTQTDTVFFYTEVKEQEGDTITHVWKNGDKEIYRKSFPVNGPRWRVWSSMVTDNFNSGDNISVEVQNQNGENLYVGNLGVAEANAPTPQPEPKENVSDLPIDNVPSTLDVD